MVLFVLMTLLILLFSFVSASRLSGLVAIFTSYITVKAVLLDKYTIFRMLHLIKVQDLRIRIAGIDQKKFSVNMEFGHFYHYLSHED